MSKANQKFVHADEAVSPVIGVILMVAITVVLAAVVFVLVSNLSNTKDSAPQITFTKSGSNATTVLTVASAPTPALNWADFDNSTTVANCQGNLTAGAGLTVTAGDQISFAQATGNCAGATFSLTHRATNSLVYTTTL